MVALSASELAEATITKVTDTDLGFDDAITFAGAKGLPYPWHEVISDIPSGLGEGFVSEYYVWAVKPYPEPIDVIDYVLK